MRVVVIFLTLVLEIPFAVVSTLLAVRLLGARRSWVATALAGTIGWAGGNLLQVGLNEWDWDAARLSTGTVSLSIVFTMLAAVSLDFLARPGTLARGEGAGLLVRPSPIRDLAGGSHRTRGIGRSSPSRGGTAWRFPAWAVVGPRNASRSTSLSVPRSSSAASSS